MTPASAARATVSAMVQTDDASKPVVLTEPRDTCCFYTLMKRMKRAGSCGADCTYLPVQTDIRFVKPVAVYAGSEPHPAALPGNHKLLRPPIS
ncbi:hypothetical protein [Nitratireductor sp. XY-223]|uniref:hypothetical protein n=1 Tax=Nitratireductor sp. XY-223 TaxID=2561926 RepID=UPI0010A9D748|nr:hypothetical protein [Nitratireductor sp. XY-223]